MTSFFKNNLMICIFSCACIILLPAQGIDETMAILEVQAEKYQDLADRISVLPDHLLESLNELDSKGEELNALVKDLAGTLEMATQYHGDLQNQMDSFEAACYSILEESCPEMEKAFEKYISRIEPVVEWGEEPLFLLDEIDNRYDEKFLLKTFEQAEKEALGVAAELADMREDLIKLEAECQ